ncbi:aminomethyltransferase family protein [Granulibacter bethesdensis]|uniref:aminomethyltransferase family protein n=1 Tax=Granulibacter bethesdensis TaxID=364410 RepID=UPI0003F1EDC7|nr:aminomethyltransferase family protein [Granulibacter bethesdensis]AHJ65722.1 Aminomethyltransferase [Granulibacter bethesdensis CGDNIH4]
MTISYPERHSALTSRHVALGSKMDASWNGMPIPQNYASNPYDETVLVRTKAGLFDVTALQIINVSGPDAMAVLNNLVTSDLAKISSGSSLITSIVNDEGGIIDDVIIYVDSKTEFRVSHGGGTLEPVLMKDIVGHDVVAERDDDVHILSLQGPLSGDILQPHTELPLSSLSYFSHAQTTLFGKPVRIARGGYSGETGYEVFCTSEEAGPIWDMILEAGKSYGAAPVSWSCLDIVRLEGGLLFFPYDMPAENTTPWEVNMGWSIDLQKTAFRGKKALEALRGQERSTIIGLEVLSKEAAEAGTPIFHDGVQVGQVTSSIFSQYLMKSLAIATIKPSLSALGTAVSVGESAQANIVRMPFYDPLRLRTHPR